MSAIAAEPISTRRLTLLPLRTEHADEMAAVLADPDLHAFTGGSPLTPQALRSRYERLIAGSPDPSVSWCNWVIQLRDPRCLAGTVQATISAGDGPAAEVAWVVGTPWQGRGIATEAARALIAWLGQQSVQTVIAHIHPRHQASAAVAAASGLTPTGHRQDGEIRWRLTMTRKSKHPQVLTIAQRQVRKPQPDRQAGSQERLRIPQPRQPAPPRPDRLQPRQPATTEPGNSAITTGNRPETRSRLTSKSHLLWTARPLVHHQLHIRLLDADNVHAFRQHPDRALLVRLLNPSHLYPGRQYARSRHADFQPISRAEHATGGT